jgi:hypothetical protein
MNVASGSLSVIAGRRPASDCRFRFTGYGLKSLGHRVRLTGRQ